ncbi:serine/arginine repetitive matrix protein 2-like [Epinephelus moara]|uniref:serine/arginine repetitive matrix protein 2-like n=1 Tax=Epinephelus moara TaxID=300413 RepID=UPI00214E96C2|nr:serine/arginine repetitive matrix protein 2-like [Epinephelus moara]
MPHHTTRSPFLSLSLSLSLLSLSRPSALCSLIRSAGSTPAVSSFAAAEQQLASFSAGSREGKARAEGRVEEEKVVGDEKEEKRWKKRRRRRRRRSFVKHPSLPSSLSGSSSSSSSSISTTASITTTTAAATTPAAGSSVSCRDLPPPSPQGALPGTGRGREITTSQLAADPRQGIRRRGGRKEGEGILEEAVRRAEERQHPGLQESRGGEKKRGSHYARVGPGQER